MLAVKFCIKNHQSIRIMDAGQGSEMCSGQFIPARIDSGHCARKLSFIVRPKPFIAVKGVSVNYAQPHPKTSHTHTQISFVNRIAVKH